MVADLSDLFDLRGLLSDPAASPGAFAGLLGLQVLFSGFFYLAFVFGIADGRRGGGLGVGRAWFVR